MRVIFLDFDGVINNHETFKMKALWNAIDPELVNKVIKIQNETGAKIVISSAWRHGRKLSWFQNKLAKFGVNPKSIIGMTPDMPHLYLGERWLEISEWLMEHEHVTSFVILDDIPFFGLLSHCHVYCDDEVGLTDTNVKSAILILNKDWSDLIELITEELVKACA